MIFRPEKLVGICSGLWFMGACLMLSIGFVYWLSAETEEDKVGVVLDRFERLVLEDRDKEAMKYARQELAAVSADSLSIAWLPLVRFHGVGHEMLGYYVQILKIQPDYESLYAEIEGLLGKSPRKYQEQIRPKLIADINSIPGINEDYLEKYNLKAK